MNRQRTARILIFAALLAGMAGILTTVRPAEATRLHGPVFVSTCKVLSASGTTYVLTANLSSAGPCLVISASSIVLNLNGHSVTGTSGTGRGVVTASGATGAVVTNGNIRHWGVGLYVAGKNARLMKLNLMNNRTAIMLMSAANSTVTQNTFPGNAVVSIMANLTTTATITQNVTTGDGAYGIWIRSSAGVTVANNRISQSGIAGIFVGCTTGGIKNTLGCKRSTHDLVASNRIVYSIHLGIAIDHGNRSIQVQSNNVSGSGKFDLFDSNSTCGTDIWTADVYTTHNQACAK